MLSLIAAVAVAAASVAGGAQAQNGARRMTARVPEDDLRCRDCMQVLIDIGHGAAGNPWMQRITQSYFAFQDKWESHGGHRMK